MGCSSSTEEVDIAIVPGAPSQPARHSGSVKVVPEAEAQMLQTVLPDTKPAPAMSGEESPPLVPPAPAGKAPEDEEAVTKQAPSQPGLPADGAEQRAESSALRTPFPIPEGWRVVCRLSAGDVRSRWGSRPRPAPPGAVGSAAVGIEADLVSPEMSQPLRLPLQLLPQWTEPSVGSDFLGRYEVRGELPSRAGFRGSAFEVYDRQDRSQRALQVCHLARESDVRLFIERLQLESLDPGSRLFLRLRDVALALPGRLAIIEDMPCSTLWDSFERTDPGTDLAAKVATVAKAVLEGLARLHAHGWAHCGVTPRSVCLALDGSWKLTSLESARKVKDLAAAAATSPLASTGTAVPPEALFRLPLTDKVDVWQLGVSLCEAVLRKSVHAGCVEADALSAPGHIVALVGFLGPLPDTLVARHPSREDLFTPEGHVLRPATPGGGEQVLEAIEPSLGQSAVDRGPWSEPVAEALSRTGVGDGVPEALDFLALLLHPDPDERPSALEALAHNFLRFAQPPAGQLEGGDALDKDKSTTAGSSQDEDSEERRHAAKHVTITDGKKDSAGKGEKVEGGGITRKGTGFVHVGELPPSDDEDEEEEEQRPAAKAKPSAPPEKKVQVQVQAEAKKADKSADGMGSGGITRKGTGFVHVGELPPSDDEDEEEEEQKARPKTVQIQEPAGSRASQGSGEKKEGKLQRKGTGFVYVGELPPSDDDDEEEEEKAPAPKQKVQIKEPAASKNPDGGPMTRKGTGFVNKSDLPADDDEDDDEVPQKHAHFQQAPSSASAKPKEPAKPMRKGTGFVNVSDLPDTDEEDEEEAPPPPKPQPAAGPVKTEGVRFDPAQDAKATASGQKMHVKVQRKGTGFVNVGDLPDSEDDEDEEDGGAAAKKLQAKGKAQPQPQKLLTGGGGVVRKGTGFVHVGELPPSDDEDEEDEKPAPQAKGPPAVKAVQIQPSPKKEVSGGLTRKGTGYVHATELPPSDDEDDEEEEEPPAAKKGHVTIKESKEAKGEPSEDKMTRKGTGFVSKAELPPEDEDDEDRPRPEKKLQFEEAEQDRLAKPKEVGGKPVRKGTGFVNVNELPDTDDEEED